MGSTTVPNSNRKDIIDEVFEGWDNEKAGIKVETRCIAKQYKGSSYAGTVYAVMEQTYTKDGMPVKKERFIMLALLQYRREDRGWNYKTLEECEGPYKFDCPMKYLDMVPCPDEPFAKSWRKKCVLSRELKQKRRFLNREMKAGRMTYQAAQDTYNLEQKAHNAKLAALQVETDKEYEIFAAKRIAEKAAKKAQAIPQEA